MVQRTKIKKGCLLDMISVLPNIYNMNDFTGSYSKYVSYLAYAFDPALFGLKYKVKH